MPSERLELGSVREKKVSDLSNTATHSLRTFMGSLRYIYVHSVEPSDYVVMMSVY